MPALRALRALFSPGYPTEWCTGNSTTGTPKRHKCRYTIKKPGKKNTDKNNRQCNTECNTYVRSRLSSKTVLWIYSFLSLKGSSSPHNTRKPGPLRRIWGGVRSASAAPTPFEWARKHNFCTFWTRPIEANRQHFTAVLKLRQAVTKPSQAKADGYKVQAGGYQFYIMQDTLCTKMVFFSSKDHRNVYSRRTTQIRVTTIPARVGDICCSEKTRGSIADRPTDVQYWLTD